MGFWKKFRDYARAGATAASILGLRVKGVPVSEIQEAAEREGGHVAEVVREFKKPKKAPKD